MDNHHQNIAKNKHVSKVVNYEELGGRYESGIECSSWQRDEMVTVYNPLQLPILTLEPTTLQTTDFYEREYVQVPVCL